jgi:hypothetical protein
VSLTNPDLPLYDDADEITVLTTAAVVGKTFADVDSATSGFSSGPALTTTAVPAAWDPGVVQAKTCAAGAKCLGVFTRDAASGSTVLVLTHNRILPVTAGAAITAGQEVQSDASGNAIPLAAGRPNGKALSSAAPGADCFIRLY